MKAIMISIKPKYVSMILNKEKTIEVRKRFPSDYVGWVYIYCTKAPLKNCSMNDIAFYCMGSGKVVARFWCDKVEEIKQMETIYGYKRPLGEYLKDSCLSFEEMHNYLKDKTGYAIHITKLEIFDEPEEISEFVPYNIKQDHYKPFPTCDFRLTRAPQSWQYIEV